MPAEDATFADLAAVCLGAMGWENSHLHEFYDQENPTPKRIGMILEPEDEDYLDDEDDVALSDRFNLEGQVFSMVYDLGDNWEHSITLEEIRDEETLAAPVIVGGKNACPPEDVGGIPGYYMMVDALKDSGHESHESMLEWLGYEEGETWDLKEFDVDEAQELILTYWSDEEVDMEGFLDEIDFDEEEDDDFEEDDSEDEDWS